MDCYAQLLDFSAMVRISETIPTFCRYGEETDFPDLLNVEALGDWRRTTGQSRRTDTGNRTNSSISQKGKAAPRRMVNRWLLRDPWSSIFCRRSHISFARKKVLLSMS